MRIFDIKKIFTNIVCIVIVIVGIITCSHVLSFDLSETFISNDVIDNYNNSNVTFAIYVENDDGEYEEYTKSISSFSSLTNAIFNENYSGCIDYDGNVLNGVLSYEDGVASVNTEVTTYCTLYFDIYILDCVEEGLTLAECILRSENDFQTEDAAITYIKGKGTPDFSVTATTDEGLYYATDDYGDSYYFRGAVTDNYVYFAGYYWRVIRINGDGSVRMIYAGSTQAYDNGESSKDQITTYSTYTNVYKSNAYVGYMYGNTYTEGTTTSTTLTLQTQYYYYASDYTFDPSTGNFILSDDAEQQVWNDSLEGYYTCKDTSTKCTKLYEIDSYYDDYRAVYYKYTSSSTIVDGARTFIESKSESTSIGSFATQYYYGKDYTYDSSIGYTLVDYDFYTYDGTDALNDYFICGDGGYSECTILYHIETPRTDTIANVTKYTLTTNDYATTHANKNDSIVKTVVDKWYEDNILNQSDGNNSYSKYLSDTLFCNDRSLYSGTGTAQTATIYSSYRRLYLNKTPTLTCPNKTNDGFTVSDTKYGNGALTYPIALITADEAMMAGGIYTTTAENKSYYLYSGNTYMTMTPSSYYDAAFKYFVNANGNVYGYIKTSSSGATISGGVSGVRPVINLSSSVILTGGDGTMDNPYQVSLS